MTTLCTLLSSAGFFSLNSSIVGVIVYPPSTIGRSLSSLLLIISMVSFWLSSLDLVNVKTGMKSLLSFTWNGKG